MLENAKQALLSKLISLTLHRIERLNEEEKQSQDSFMAKLNFPERKTKNPLIVALIGLVGSGKSMIAKTLAPKIGATVIESDEIRVELRNKVQGYEKARLISENAALDALKRGSNVIMDSDFVDSKKAASLRAKAKKAGAKVVFLRISCDYDVMVGRIISAKYHEKDFFGGASSKWEGDAQTRGAVVKLREVWRRTPQHYRWVNENGGRWELNNPPVKLFAKIDMTEEKKWRTRLEIIAKDITAQF